MQSTEIGKRFKLNHNIGLSNSILVSLRNHVNYAKSFVIEQFIHAVKCVR